MKGASFKFTKSTILLLSLLVLVSIVAGAGSDYSFKTDIFDRLVGRGAAANPEMPPIKSSAATVLEATRDLQKKIQDESNVAVPPSPWIEAEKKRYLAVLKAAKPAVVVLPFQIPAGKNQLGIDLPARMVMAYMTAQRIASGTDLKVADVEFVARAIGDPRHLARSDASAFGYSIGATTVIYGEASHDGERNLTVTITAIGSWPPYTNVKTWTKAGIEISDTATPELAYRRWVDEAVGQLGYTDSKPVETRPYIASGKAVPDTPVRATAGNPENPADGIWVQELIGSLYPEEPPRARDRVFERALAGMEYLSPASPDYRVLQARALARLGRRIAALSVIGDSVKTPEERAFAGFLNGNVPEMEQAIAQIKRPLPKLIAELELAWTSSYYDLDRNNLPLIAKRISSTVPKQWAPGIIWFVTGQNWWNVSPTMPVKLVMDSQFPVQGYSAEDVIRGKALIGAANPKVMLEVEGAPLVHAGKVIEQNGADWCCVPQAWKPRPFQYLNLLAAHAEAMLIGSVDHESYVQGRTDEALQLADMIDEVVFQRGSWLLQLRKARLMMTTIRKTPSREAGVGISGQLYQTSRQLRQWNSIYPEHAAEITEYEEFSSKIHFAAMVKQASSSGYNYAQTHEFIRDFPAKYEALFGSQEYKMAAHSYTANFAVLERACLASVLYPDACETWRSRLEAAEQKDAARKVEKVQLVNRFHGNPKRTAILTAVLKARGEIDGAAAFARDSIKLNRDSWEGYQALGEIYMQGGKFKQAADAYLSYPRFKNPGTENTVSITNYALVAASELARRGAVKDARPLYEIAVRYHNGSEASLIAMTRFAYFDRRYGDAELIVRERVQRYQTGAGMRDYVSLLFALGDSKNAWAGVQEALPRVAGFSPWQAVPVGFRVDGADIETIRKWVKTTATPPDTRIPIAFYPQAQQAFTIAIQTLAVDRPAGSIEALREMGKELFPERNTPVLKDLDKMEPQKRAALQKAVQRAWPGDYLNRVVTGYLAHKRGDYKNAWDAFQRYNEPATGIDGRDASDASYVTLPYHAFAAVKVGQTDAFTTNMENWSNYLPSSPQHKDQPPYPRFDVHLARAVLAASKGNHDDAKKELLLARSTIAEPGTRPLPPEYVFAEICEMLAADSGMRDYLDIAVEWSRAYQIYEPWAAWAYAFEAKYGKADADRAKALAIAQHLDRNSARIAGLDASLVNQAKNWLTTNKPFPRERRSPNQKAL